MATETTFLKLRKTASAELVDIKRDVNNNLEKLDKEVGVYLDQSWLDFDNPMTNVGVRILRCRYKVWKRVLLYQANLTISSVPTGNMMINMPPGITLASLYLFLNNAGGSLIGQANKGGVITTFSQWTALLSGGPAGVGIWTASVPAVWAVGDQLSFDIRAEIG